MRHLLLLLLSVLVSEIIFSQDFCIRNTSFNRYKNYRISSESGGIYNNAYLIPYQELQLETNNSFGSQKIRGIQQSVFLSTSQARYGLLNNIELNGGIALMLNPSESKIFNEYYLGHFGAKLRLVKYEGRYLQTFLSLKAQYMLKQANSDNEKILLNGYSGQVSGSVKIVNYATMDIAYGLHQFFPDSDLQDIFSVQVTLKSDESVIGVFVGNHQHQYIENMFDMGFILTDNKRLISHIAFGMIDTMGAINMAFSYLF